jgi:acetyl-CoA synthase
MPLATYVEVAGARMREDFEPVVERRIHHWFNYMEGVMHTGQRNLFRIRVGKEALAKGLKLKDLGEVIYAMVMDEFGAVVDKCQVTLVTDEARVKEILQKEGLPTYEARDSRLASMTDESVDCFYSCILCQSFAPAHCCVITPERLGLCGAVSWLDASATKELADTGPCQPIGKTGTLDDKKGIYESVNKAVESATHGSVNKVSLYSIMEDPMTSCGCFECICGIMPEANGVVIVNREYTGMTPTGMTFGELASMTGGGVQTPGFMGHGRHFIASKKFVHAEGGIARIVWMPKELKNDVTKKLNKAAKDLYGIENFADMICDESIASEAEGVLAYLEEKKHPALALEAIM